MDFPEGFWWGTATAGHQIEGDNRASNWWEWEQLGLVEDHSTSKRACDYWNRWRDDHELMVDLGHNAFRMGVEWARIEPTRGRFDDAALDQYVEMLADLQARGIKVCLTLNHWVIPAWFAAAGDWCGHSALADWERFVRHVVPRLAPYVDRWVTLNEPMVPVLAGNLAAYHPPAHRSPLRAARVFRRLLAAHAVAYRAVHELVPTAPDGGATQVGIASAYQWIEPYHERGWRRPLEALIGRVVAHISFDMWDRAVLSGRIPFPCGLGRRVQGLRGSTDFVGVNYYMRISVRLHPAALSNVASGGYDCPPGIEQTEMGWQVYPPGFRKVLNKVWKRFGKPIYVTENGCADRDDELRRRYLLSHLAELHKAIGDGCDVRGYLQWTFIDNFEWREGFVPRFGLVEMNPDDPDLTRKPRRSAYMYKDLIAANAISDELVDEYSPGALDRWR